MKRLCFVLLLCILALPSFAENPWNYGYMHVATNTITLYGTSPVDIGQYVPRGATAFSVTAFGGQAIVNCRADIEGGAHYNGDSIASGSFLKWTGGDPTRDREWDIYALGVNPAATVTLRLRAWSGTLP